MDTLHQPEFYNAADDLLQRNSDAGRGGKVIIVDDDGRHTHDELVDRVNRCANVLREFRQVLGIASCCALSIPLIFTPASWVLSRPESFQCR